MYYVVVEHEVHVFFSEADARKFYAKAEAEYREPFATQDEGLARLVRDGNIAEDYLRRVR